jgi:hypothetical protein
VDSQSWLVRLEVSVVKFQELLHVKQKLQHYKQNYEQSAKQRRTSKST